MARNTENDHDDEPTGTDEGGENQKRATGFQLWFEEAWEGWLKSVGVIVLCALAYVVYKFDLVTETVSGLVLVAAVVLGTLASVALPAWPAVRMRTPGTKGLFITMMAMALLGAGYPAFRSVIRSPSLAEAKMSAEGETVTLKPGAAGPYDLLVSGHLKAGGAETEASYGVTASGGGGEDQVDDVLERKVVRTRVSRKGGATQTAIAESNEKTHALAHVRGGEVTVKVDRLDADKLEDGISVSLHSAGLPLYIFWALCGLAFVIGVWFDARLTDSKGKLATYLAVGIGFVSVFGAWMPFLATPHSMVRPAVDAVLRAVFVGALPGWLFGAIGRFMMGPKRKPAKK
jgi:hypothetical protein